MNLYYRGAKGIFLVYDCTSDVSFENLNNWVNQIKELAVNSVQVIVICNKCELCDEREVTVE